MHRQTLSDYIKRTNNENLIKIQKQVSEEIRRRKIQEYEGIESEIDFLQQKLSVKEYECEELKDKLYQIEDIVKLINEQLPEDNIIREITLILNDCNNIELNRYRKALEEIEEFCITYSDNHDAYETVYKYILDIINKAKEEE